MKVPPMFFKEMQHVGRLPLTDTTASQIWLTRCWIRSRVSPLLLSWDQFWLLFFWAEVLCGATVLPESRTDGGRAVSRMMRWSGSSLVNADLWYDGIMWLRRKAAGLTFCSKHVGESETPNCTQCEITSQTGGLHHALTLKRYKASLLKKQTNRFTRVKYLMVSKNHTGDFTFFSHYLIRSLYWTVQVCMTSASCLFHTVYKPAGLTFFSSFCNAEFGYLPVLSAWRNGQITVSPCTEALKKGVMSFFWLKDEIYIDQSKS